MIRTQRHDVGGFVRPAVRERRHVMHMHQKVESTDHALVVIALPCELPQPASFATSPQASSWTVDAHLPVLSLTFHGAKVRLPNVAWEALQFHSALIASRDRLVDAAGGSDQPLPLAIALVGATRAVRLRGPFKKLSAANSAGIPSFATTVVAVVRALVLVSLEELRLPLRVGVAHDPHWLAAAAGTE